MIQNSVMMIFGGFVFMRQTVPYLESSQETQWRYARNERIGRSARVQYLGAGEDTLTLSGVLLPEITGGDMSLSLLRTLAYRGRAWPLIEGTGRIYGRYVLENLTEIRSEFFGDGKARRIEFTLALSRAGEDIRESLADSLGDDWQAFTDWAGQLPGDLADTVPVFLNKT